MNLGGYNVYSSIKVVDQYMVTRVGRQEISSEERTYRRANRWDENIIKAIQTLLRKNMDWLILYGIMSKLYWWSFFKVSALGGENKFQLNVQYVEQVEIVKDENGEITFVMAENGLCEIEMLSNTETFIG